MAAGYALFMGAVTLARHHTFGTYAFDLGIHSQALDSIARRGYPLVTLYGPQPVNQFGDHFAPIFYLLTPLSLLFSDARALLVVQTLLLASAVAPVYLLARSKLASQALAVTLAAAAFMGEPVGWRRYVAIGVGFAGVLVIARPGTDGFNVYALWALASVGCIVLRDLSTRRLSPDTSALGVSLVTSAALTLVAGLAALFGDWAPIAPAHFALLGIAAVGLLVGYVFSVHAMRRGDIGFVQPFRYSLLVFAIINGIVLFGEWPDVWTLVGAAMVAGTGLYTLHRERAATNAPPATLRERRG